MTEEALWQLVNDPTFPRMDNKMLAMLMPEEWKHFIGLIAYSPRSTHSQLQLPVVRMIEPCRVRYPSLPQAALSIVVMSAA
jgi:hypothetical protein